MRLVTMGHLESAWRYSLYPRNRSGSNSDEQQCWLNVYLSRSRRRIAKGGNRLVLVNGMM